MKPCIVMRSHNDMPLIKQTLESLSSQDMEFELVCLDNASEDGTTEELYKYTSRVIDIPKGAYIPGKVINLGMELTEGEWVVFLNSDCTPIGKDWLRNLLSATNLGSDLAAVFGRQSPRPDCLPLFAKDTDDTYGDGSRQKYWKHCFSMACSGVSRKVWKRFPFDEKLKYSEDIDWTWRARQKGYTIRYVPNAVVYHSHNYTLKQFYRRHYGEGRAEATIFEWSQWETSFLRYSAMPFARQIMSDLKYCVTGGQYAAAFHSVPLRLSQMLGRRAGFKQGLRER